MSIKEAPMARRREHSSELDQALETSYWREADARAVLRALVESGETLPRFAARHGIEPGRLRRWEKRLGRKPEFTFHPVEVVDRAPKARAEINGRPDVLELVLRGGRRVVVSAEFDADFLRRLVATVESWC